MKYRRHGKTDLELSEIGFGTADNAGLLVKGSERDQLDAIAAAIEGGVNYFETSPSFGRGVAETNLGKAFKALGVRPHIGTMVEILPDGFADIGKSLETALDGSLERLGLDGVDILICHNMPRKARDVNEPTWQPVTYDDLMGSGLTAFERIKRAGKARYFGFATELCDPETVGALLDTGRFDHVNVWYSIVNPTAARRLPPAVRYGRDYPDYGGIIERARANGVGVAAFRALTGGALSTKIIAEGASARHPNAGGSYSRNPQQFEPEIVRSRPFAFLETPTRTLPQAVYAYVLANPAVTTIVAGFSDANHVREALVEVPPLSAAELARVDAVYASNFGLAS